MKLNSILRRLKKTFSTSQRSTVRRRCSILLVEHLEDRTLLSTTYLPHELLVQFRPEATDSIRHEVRGSANASLAERIHTRSMATAGQGVLERIVLPEAINPETAAKMFQNNPHVQYAEPNWVYQTAVVSNDPYYTTSSRLWGMYSDDLPTPVGASGTTNQFGSQAEEAWNADYIGSSSVFVGIIDEGFQNKHPDLAANSWTNPYDPVDGVDNDGNGYVDDVNGWDFYSNDNSIYDGTADDHGTHVAGTIGAKGGNGIGVAGVNWNVTMISAKFLGPNGGSLSGAIQALDYLTGLKTLHPAINIVASNNSWGGGGFSQTLLDAITRAANKGILFIAAAGNSNANNDATASYPSNYNTTAGAGYDAVIAVAAIDKVGAKASFSSYGATTVDLGAPGVDINSTLPTDTYGAYSGTSMATPHVTGAVALYAAANPGATASQIRAAILNTTTQTTSLSGITVTGGRLNVSALMGIVAPPSLSINNVTLVEGNSGTTVATFTVTLSSASAQTVTVDYVTADGTATTAGSDYVAIPKSTLIFAPGTTTQTISVTVNGDTVVEPNETFFVNLTDATNAPIADAQGQGTIQNDDVPPLPALSINDVSILEGNGGKKQLTFTVSLSSAATTTVSVRYATANGNATAPSDYKTVAGTATIAPGLSSTTITVTIYGDRTPEANETFVVNLTNPVNATLADGQGQGMILNDDGGTLGGQTAATQAALITSSLLSEIDAVIAKVSSLNLNGGRKNPLIAQLGAAKVSLTKENAKAAANQLGASINFLNALKKSRQLGAAVANPLIEEIEGIRSSLLE